MQLLTPDRLTPNEPCSVDSLRKLGVVSWKLDADKFEADEKLEAIRKVRGYSYKDIIEVTPETLPGYEQKIKHFFEEHLHTDEEIRYILAGSGKALSGNSELAICSFALVTGLEWQLRGLAIREINCE